MRILLYGKSISEAQLPAVKLLFSILEKENAQVYIYGSYFEVVRAHIPFSRAPRLVHSYADLKPLDIDFVLTLGGDGTILNVATLIRDLQIPIMGINLGRLGFLASIEQQYIDKAFEYLKQGKYRLEHRTMLYLDSTPEIFGDARFALNDFTILKRDNSSMITIHAYINGEFLNSYWADGLIIATPTGSTGYSLSCGGPIVYPDSNSLVVTPVAPHNLNVRPLVISDDAVLTFEVEGRAENFLCTLDSRFEIINSDFKLAVRRCEFGIDLVQLDEMSFSKTMRNKLMWGFDTRKHF
jgi:NAD+ kinase